MAGYDVEPAIALHPTEGWAAVVWSNWLGDFPDEATVFVKVQKGTTWGPARGVNTEPVSKGAGSPAIAIDRFGRIHVVYEGIDTLARYTYSDDRGQTWSQPATIPQPSGMDGALLFQLWIDQDDTPHVLYVGRTGCNECMGYGHGELRGGNWRTETIGQGTKLLYGDITSIKLPNGQIRLIAALGCRNDCPYGPGVEILYRDGQGGWFVTSPPANQGKRVSPQVIQWVDLVQFLAVNGQQYVCVAWGQYATSSNQSSCSTDAGASWGETEIIAYYNKTTAIDPTAPTATINPITGEQGLGQESGQALHMGAYHPELVYDPDTDRLLALWLQMLLVEPGMPGALVYSYRDLDNSTWHPFIDGATEEPPLRLFDETRRNAPRKPRVAYSGNDLAAVVWIELEQDENVDVYFSLFNPGALMAQER